MLTGLVGVWSRGELGSTPGVRLPWHKEVFLTDVETCRSRGIGHVTTFAAWIDADYVQRHGELVFPAEYGAGLS